MSRNSDKYLKLAFRISSWAGDCIQSTQKSAKGKKQNWRPRLCIALCFIKVLLQWKGDVRVFQLTDKFVLRLWEEIGIQWNKDTRKFHLDTTPLTSGLEPRISLHSAAFMKSYGHKLSYCNLSCRVLGVWIWCSHKVIHFEKFFFISKTSWILKKKGTFSLVQSETRKYERMCCWCFPSFSSVHVGICSCLPDAE